MGGSGSLREDGKENSTFGAYLTYLWFHFAWPPERYTVISHSWEYTIKYSFTYSCYLACCSTEMLP